VIWNTFREGLLPNAIPLPLTTYAFLAGVSGDSRQLFSTFSGIPLFSFSWELEGPMASLLATGVMLLTMVFLNVGFLTGVLGFGIALTPLGSPRLVQPPAGELGVPLAGAFEKKLRIDAFFDPTLEFCFFNVAGGAGVLAASGGSFALAMMGVG